MTKECRRFKVQAQANTVDGGRTTKSKSRSRTKTRITKNRIEIRSYGCLPNGITVKKLSGKHESKPVNPLIAGAFHRTGAVEVWGRGTNRVIAACQKHGSAAPAFEERQGFVVVTFKTPMVPTAVEGPERPKLQPESGAQVGTKSGLSRDQVQVLALCRQEQPLLAMMAAVGRQNRTKFRESVVKPLIESAWLELTIPDKPNSRLQRYRTTVAGKRAIDRGGRRDA